MQSLPPHVRLAIRSPTIPASGGEAQAGPGRLSADDARRTLVELQSHDALHILLALVDQRLEHVALGGEPEAVVDQLGIARHQLVLQMPGAAVEGQALDPAMRGLQDRPARRLVDAPRFHADETVLDEIEPAYTMPAADLVQALKDCSGTEVFAIHRDRVAALEADFEILGLIGREFRGDGAAEHK